MFLRMPWPVRGSFGCFAAALLCVCLAVQAAPPRLSVQGRARDVSLAGGLFTHYLLQGLASKAADANKDGKVDQREAFGYADRALQEFYLAQSDPSMPKPRPVLKQSLPADTQVILAR
ncbi:MAG: hypothetical protein HY814_03090 [Candidatus Riflebacteria bacterium]|nr:hypothetical protein [Candidatus Riflebacteria bacterium]